MQCRVAFGTEAPEMARELLTQHRYTPAPAQDMYAFGMLLAYLLFCTFPAMHSAAINEARASGSPAATLEYASSLCNKKSGALAKKVRGRHTLCRLRDCEAVVHASNACSTYNSISLLCSQLHSCVQTSTLTSTCQNRRVSKHMTCC